VRARPSAGGRGTGRWSAMTGRFVIGSGAVGAVTTTPDPVQIQIAADPRLPPPRQHHRVGAVAPRRSPVPGPPHPASLNGRALARGGHALRGGCQGVDVARPPVGRPGLPPAGLAPSLPVGEVLGEQRAPYLHHGCEGSGDGARGDVAYRIQPVHRLRPSRLVDLAVTAVSRISRPSGSSGSI
jgi:hypothetical protein